MTAATGAPENPSRQQQLAAAMRDAASTLAERAGGAVLVFAADSQSASSASVSKLRAAAGFAEAEAARRAASALATEIQEVTSRRTERVLDALPSLGDRGLGGTLITPLLFESRCHGALVIGCPGPIDTGLRSVVAAESSKLGLLLDHARISDVLDSMQAKLEEREEGDGARESQEVLELSEALFAQDIELLRNNEKLGKVEKLKNDFIEKMSRELRTPLNSIIEAIISVLTSENEALSEDSKTTLRTALDDGTEFLRTLQNILDLWRIKQRELPVEIQEVNFREVVDEAIFSIQDRLNEKPILIEQRLVEPFPKIRTDLTKVNQILYLLLENAVKFTASGEITIAAELEDGLLKCEIRDTGMGISPDDQAQMFDEFFQVDEPSSRAYSGAGLGLTLVRDLVILMEGAVSVSSEVGSGTTVSFEVPVGVA